MADLELLTDALRSEERFCVVTHENPDGDALGSLLAARLGLAALGKDVVMYLSGDAPFPGEYRFLALDDVLRELPADLGQRFVLAVDCASERRIGPDPALLEQAKGVLNVDHHHDNTRFGGVNLVVPGASSTAEIVRDLLAELDVPLTPQIAEALYVGLVTDTGRFSYTNTTPKALRLAAELVEAGAPVHEIFRHVYETQEFPKLKLLARALERAELYADGRLVISYLVRDDFAEVGAVEPYSEGIIDQLRATEGALMVALIREPPRDDGPKQRISLRSSSDAIDVSAIAREREGGGHKQAAGFSSDEPLAEIIDFLCRAFADAAPRA